MTTNDELMKKLLTSAEIEEIKLEVAQDVEKIKWGGKRVGAGRKPKTGVVLSFRVRVSEKEKQFLDYARSHNLNYDDLIQG